MKGVMETHLVGRWVQVPYLARFCVGVPLLRFWDLVTVVCSVAAEGLSLIEARECGMAKLIRFVSSFSESEEFLAARQQLEGENESSWPTAARATHLLLWAEFKKQRPARPITKFCNLISRRIGAAATAPGQQRR